MSEHGNATMLAFLGIGLMGAPMVRRLLQAGYQVRVWNRTAAKAEALRQAGVQPMASAAQAVQGAAMVISMLQDGAAVAEVAKASAQALAPGTIWIDMSSTAQHEAIEIHAQLQARGCSFVDAPVSGGVAGAEAGTLAIMVGATAAEFARATAVLSCMGRPTLVGPVGSGQVAKLCNQLIVGATLHIVAEALLLAQAAGADPKAVRQAMRGGFAESKILDVHGQRMLDRNFVPGGQVKSQLKDLRNVLVAAADAGVVLPVAALVTDTYASLGEAYASADQSAVLLALEKLNPGITVHAGRQT